jgi:hypothetical protein
MKQRIALNVTCLVVAANGTFVESAEIPAAMIRSGASGDRRKFSRWFQLAALCRDVATRVTHLIQHGKTRGAMQPACQACGGKFTVGGERIGLAREVHEHALRDIGSEVGGFHLAQGGGKNQVGVAKDDFAKRGFVVAFGIIPEELDAGPILHLPIKQPTAGKSDKVFQRDGIRSEGAHFRRDIAAKAR